MHPPLCSFLLGVTSIKQAEKLKSRSSARLCGWWCMCDFVWWWCVVMCVMMCLMLCVMMCLILCVMLCDGLFDGVNSGGGCGKVKWLILRCWGVLMTDWQTDRWMNIGIILELYVLCKMYWTNPNHNKISIFQTTL